MSPQSPPSSPRSMKRKQKCTKPGGTLREAVREIFRCLQPGYKLEYYECECGQYHITENPDKLLNSANNKDSKNDEPITNN
jgi:hypothetical protein